MDAQSNGLAEREVRALTEYVTVLDDVGRARGADGLYLVVGASGREYLVDAEERACECGDHRFRGVDCKHLERVAFATGRRAIPVRAAVELDVDPELGEHVEGRRRYVVTDGGVGGADLDRDAEANGADADPEAEADGADVDHDADADGDDADPAGRGTWVVRDRNRDRARTFDSRTEAEQTVADLEDLGVDVELLSPSSTGDPAADARLVPADGESPEAEDVVVERDDGDGVRAYALEPRTVSEDPLEWLPDAFVDVIDGTPAVNRMGFEVLAHFYDVDVETDVQVGPAETDFEYCQVEATATTPSGRRCEALGSAHVDRGDDPTLLLELADTRARKRAISVATGVGVVAVEELQSEVEAE